LARIVETWFLTVPAASRRASEIERRDELERHDPSRARGRAVRCDQLDHQAGAEQREPAEVRGATYAGDVMVTRRQAEDRQDGAPASDRPQAQAEDRGPALEFDHGRG